MIKDATFKIPVCTLLAVLGLLLPVLGPFSSKKSPTKEGFLSVLFTALLLGLE